MTLLEHLELLGIDSGHLAFRANVPKNVVERALAGKPIAAVHASRIAEKLSNLHGMHSGPQLEHGDIDGLQVIHPEELRK